MKKIILITLYCFALQLVAQSKKNPAEGIFMDKVEKTDKAVSYTHLTLPTIYSV